MNSPPSSAGGPPVDNMGQFQEQAQMALESTAFETCERLEEIFGAFERTLRKGEEIGIALTSFGVAREIIVGEVKAYGVNMIVIRGFEADSQVTLVQHVSQLSFLLQPVKMRKPEEPRRVVGFWVHP